MVIEILADEIEPGMVLDDGRMVTDAYTSDWGTWVETDDGDAGYWPMTFAKVIN
jgi:hypothetical protein